MSRSAVLGVSGSVAAYRACDLARELMRSGYTVRACLTDGAQRFVTPALFEALTGQPCLMDAFDEPERGRMAHIDWARGAEVVVVAPATANVLNMLANGYADDMLTTLALAYEGPLVLAPAMNPTMFANPATQASLVRLVERGAFVVEPSEGEVACGEQGQGKLASVAEIVSVVQRVAGVTRALAGKTVLVTTGPTEEPVDDVRMITNRSSGKMGSAVARAALLMGARVVVVAGPQRHPLPERAEVHRVRTAQEMLDAALPFAPEADFVIGVAAVADFRPRLRIEGKARSGSLDKVELVPNPDVLAALAKKAKGTVVAFAAEPGVDLGPAKRKMAEKGVQAIAVNDVSRTDAGFDGDTNDLTLVFSDGTTETSGKKSKFECALWMLSLLAERA